MKCKFKIVDVEDQGGRPLRIIELRSEPYRDVRYIYGMVVPQQTEDGLLIKFDYQALEPHHGLNSSVHFRGYIFEVLKYLITVGADAPPGKYKFKMPDVMAESVTGDPNRLLVEDRAPPIPEEDDADEDEE